MSQFEPALEYILDFEDPNRTYVAKIDNNGGGVIAGINSKSFPRQYAAIVNAPVTLRAPLVAATYRDDLWVPMKLGGLDSQDLANRVFDMEVNAGEGPAARELQQAVNDLMRGANLPTGLEVDGIIGANTLAAANGVDQGKLLIAFRARRVSRYEEILAAHPEDAKYQKAWLSRASA